MKRKINVKNILSNIIFESKPLLDQQKDQIYLNKRKKNNVHLNSVLSNRSPCSSKLLQNILTDGEDIEKDIKQEDERKEGLTNSYYLNNSQLCSVKKEMLVNTTCEYFSNNNKHSLSNCKDTSNYNYSHNIKDEDNNIDSNVLKITVVNPRSISEHEHTQGIFKHNNNFQKRNLLSKKKSIMLCLVNTTKNIQENYCIGPYGGCRKVCKTRTVSKLISEKKVRDTPNSMCNDKSSTKTCDPQECLYIKYCCYFAKRKYVEMLKIELTLLSHIMIIGEHKCTSLNCECCCKPQNFEISASNPSKADLNEISYTINKKKCKISPLFIIFYYDDNKLVDIYEFDCFNILKAHFKKKNTKTEKPLKITTSTIVKAYKICCWVNRSKVVDFLEQNNSLILPYSKTQHSCKYKDCQCCCRKKCIINEIERSTFKFISYDFHKKNCNACKLTSEDLEKELPSTIVMKKSTDTQINNDNSENNENNDAASTEVQNIIKQVLSRLSGIKLIMNEGKVAALSDRPLSNLTKVDMKMLYEILNHAQKYFDSLSSSNSSNNGDEVSENNFNYKINSINLNLDKTSLNFQSKQNILNIMRPEQLINADIGTVPVIPLNEFTFGLSQSSHVSTSTLLTPSTTGTFASFNLPNAQIFTPSMTSLPQKTLVSSTPQENIGIQNLSSTQNFTSINGVPLKLNCNTSQTLVLNTPLTQIQNSVHSAVPLPNNTVQLLVTNSSVIPNFILPSNTNSVTTQGLKNNLENQLTPNVKNKLVCVESNKEVGVIKEEIVTIEDDDNECILGF